MARRGFLEVRRCVSSTWWRVCKAILYCVALVDNGWTNVGLNLVADTFNSLSRVRSRNLVFYRRSGASGSGILRKLPRGDQAPAHNINRSKKAPNKDDPAKSHSAFAAFRTMVLSNGKRSVHIHIYNSRCAPGESGARGRGPHLKPGRS